MLTQYAKQKAGDNDTFNGDNFIFSRVEPKKVYTNGLFQLLIDLILKNKIEFFTILSL